MFSIVLKTHKMEDRYLIEKKREWENRCKPLTSTGQKPTGLDPMAAMMRRCVHSTTLTSEQKIAQLTELLGLLKKAFQGYVESKNATFLTPSKLTIQLMTHIKSLQKADTH
jgi:hypothetical protein